MQMETVCNASGAPETQFKNHDKLSREVLYNSPTTQIQDCRHRYIVLTADDVLE